MRGRFFVIHNPKAGSVKRRLYADTLARLQRLGTRTETFEPAGRTEATVAAAQAARSGYFDAVIAAGGDGTIRDAAEGLLGTSTPLGIIPLGTGNVFAHELKLPRAPQDLTRTLVEGDICRMPVGLANGRPFLFVVGVGLDAEAVRVFERDNPRHWGRAGFLLPVLRTMISYRAEPLRVATARGETEAHWVIVTRTKRYACNLLLAPEADLRQTGFHLLRMSGSGLAPSFRQLAAFAIGCLRYDPGAHLERVDWARIKGNPSTPVQIDGEVAGSLPLEICQHPDQLNVIVPG